MPHMVIFQSAEGKPGYHQTDGLDEALRFVEHLRNQEHVPDARVYRLEEIPLAVKTYYKVEIAGAGGASTPASEADDPVRAVVESDLAQQHAPPAAAGASAASPAAGDDRPGAADSLANGGAAPRFGRFNRG